MSSKSNTDTASRSQTRYDINILYYMLVYICNIKWPTQIYDGEKSWNVGKKQVFFSLKSKNVHNMHNIGKCLSLFNEVSILHVKIQNENSKHFNKLTFEPANRFNILVTISTLYGHITSANLTPLFYADMRIHH